MKLIIFKISALMAILSFFLTLFHHFNLESSDETVRKKYHCLLNQADEINILFLGTSSTFLTFDPTQIDSIMDSRGFATRTFNFGLHAMPVVAQQYHLEKLLTYDFPKLKYVIFELSYPGLSLNAKELFPWRKIEIHDSKRLRTYVNVFWQQPSWRIFILATLKRVNYFLRNLSLSGRGERLYESITGVQNSPIDTTHSFRKGRYNGFKPAGVGDNVRTNIKPLAEDSLARKRFHSLINKLRDNSPVTKFRAEDKAVLAIYKDIIEVCKKKNIQPIILLPPKTQSYRSLLHNYQASNLNAPLINLSSPERFPKIYDIKQWYDINHLLWSGAKMATQSLVEHLLELPEFMDKLNTAKPDAANMHATSDLQLTDR